MAISNLILTAQANFVEHPIENVALLFVLVPLLYVFANEFVRRQARIAGIGGPKGLPLIGNLWQIRKNAAEKYRQWARKHGSVYQIQLGNVPVVVVNSAAAAKVLFGQNAQALSSRPEFYTFHKVSTYHLTIISSLPWLTALRFSLIQLERPSEHHLTAIH